MQQHSRNLAKRQLTWIRGQMSDFLQVPTADAAVDAAGRALGASVPALDEASPEVKDRPMIRTLLICRTAHGGGGIGGPAGSGARKQGPLSGPFSFSRVGLEG